MTPPEGSTPNADAAQVTGPLTHLPSDPFASFMGQPVETDLSRLEADFAIVGAPFGSPSIARF